ncbi:hypothetical protein LIER_05782 [Lithospermum erythrorhizon]|uniref:Uncharacterized protein n=1 Tax=Lithospermum erythrorhizon TaxID=34254 RepID=A0AAV3P220_LITER
MTGGGILRETPSPPATRRESPVRIIDAVTLNHVQLYTSMGAEVQYGDLVFTPYQDPFANVALKQGEANNYVFEEIDNYPVNSVAPVSTDADQVLHAGFSTRTVVPSFTEDSASFSANEQGENSGTLPAFTEN